eukprot:3806338-Amphidinium_carterae.2
MLALQQLIADGNCLPVRQLLMAGQPGAVLASTQDQFSSICQPGGLRSSVHAQAVVTPHKYQLLAAGGRAGHPSSQASGA